MGKGFRASASREQSRRINKRRLKGIERALTVDIDITQIDKLYLNKFLGKIHFWSFTVRKIQPSDHTAILRVTTHRHIPKHKLFSRVEGAFPEGSKVSLVRAYVYTHSFDIRLSKPMRVDTIIWRVTKALEGVL